MCGSGRLGAWMEGGPAGQWAGERVSDCLGVSHMMCCRFFGLINFVIFFSGIYSFVDKWHIVRHS